MTRDKLMALRRTCPKCNGSGLWHEIYINGDGLADEDGGACETCLGTGYVLPATEEVLGSAEPVAVRNAVADIAQMEVGPSQEKLLAALCNMVEMAWFPGCPGELEWPCPCGATGTEDVACERDPHLCALEWAGLTESEAAALWKRMKEAASK